MKKFTLLLVSLFTVFTLQANNGGKYEKAMKANLGKLKTANTAIALQNVANQFERISNAETKKWLPNYYAAYAYIRMVRFEEDAIKKDQLLDKAEALLKKAATLEANNSEIVTLEAYLAMTRLTVDPMARGQQYSGITFGKIGKAKSLNPNNPRPYFLEATLKMNMPPAFGGGKDAACPIYKKAAEKFDNFKPKAELMPNWGKEVNAKMKKKGGCE